MDAPAFRPFPDDWQGEARTGHRLRRYVVEGEGYDVALAIPQATDVRGLPLLLVMDAASHFDAAAAAAAALARRTAKTGVGPTIVAGIASGVGWSHDAARRERDLVPDGPAADRLLALVRDRLVPDIAGLAEIDRSAVAILGHSLGGLFALHAAACAPELFSTAIAVSPSFWRLPDLAGRVAAAVDGRGVRILLASGEKEPPRISAGLATACPQLRRTARVERIELAGEDHGSIPFAALPATLRFVHAGRSPPA